LSENILDTYLSISAPYRRHTLTRVSRSAPHPSFDFVSTLLIISLPRPRPRLTTGDNQGSIFREDRFGLHPGYLCKRPAGAVVKVVDSSFPKFLRCRRSLSIALRSTSIWSGTNTRATQLSEHSALSNDLGIPGHPPLFFSLLEKRSVTYGSRA
jgi:hypothetical protein